MQKNKKTAPPTNFLIGLGTNHKVSIQNPTSSSSAPVLLANPSTSANIIIRPNRFVQVILQGNLRESAIIVGAAPSGTFFQQSVTLKPGQSIVLQAGTTLQKFTIKKQR